MPGQVDRVVQPPAGPVLVDRLFSLIPAWHCIVTRQVVWWYLQRVDDLHVDKEAAEERHTELWGLVINIEIVCLPSKHRK